MIHPCARPVLLLFAVLASAPAVASQATPPILTLTGSNNGSQFYTDVEPGPYYYFNVGAEVSAAGTWYALACDVTFDVGSAYFNGSDAMPSMAPTQQGLDLYLSGYYQGRDWEGTPEQHSGYPNLAIPPDLMTAVLDRALPSAAPDTVVHIGDPLWNTVSGPIAQPFGMYPSQWDQETCEAWPLVYGSFGINSDAIIQTWAFKKWVAAGHGGEGDDFLLSDQWAWIEKNYESHEFAITVQPMGMRGPTINPYAYPVYPGTPLTLVGYPTGKPKFTTGNKTTIRIPVGVPSTGHHLTVWPNDAPLPVPPISALPNTDVTMYVPGGKKGMQLRMVGTNGEGTYNCETSLVFPGGVKFKTPATLGTYRITSFRYLLAVATYGPWTFVAPNPFGPAAKFVTVHS